LSLLLVHYLGDGERERDADRRGDGDLSLPFSSFSFSFSFPFPLLPFSSRSLFGDGDLLDSFVLLGDLDFDLLLDRRLCLAPGEPDRERERERERDRLRFLDREASEREPRLLRGGGERDLRERERERERDLPERLRLSRGLRERLRLLLSGQSRAQCPSSPQMKHALLSLDLREPLAHSTTTLDPSNSFPFTSLTASSASRLSLNSTNP